MIADRANTGKMGDRVPSAPLVRVAGHLICGHWELGVERVRWAAPTKLSMRPPRTLIIANVVGCTGDYRYVLAYDRVVVLSCRVRDPDRKHNA